MIDLQLLKTSTTDTIENNKTVFFGKMVLISGIIAISIFLLMVIMLVSYWKLWLFYILIISVIVATVLYFTKKGFLRTAGFFYISLSQLIIFSLAWLSGGITSPILFSAPLYILIGGIILEKKCVLWVSCTALLLVTVLILADTMNIKATYPVIHTPITYLIVFANFIILLAIFQFFFIKFFNSSLFQYKQELQNRKKVEAELKKNEDLRYRVFESSKIPIVVLDAKTHRFIDCNQAAVNIYQFKTREEVLGKTPMDVSAQTQYDGSSSSEKEIYYIEKALTEGSVTFEWRHQRANGEIWDAETFLMRFSTPEQDLLQFSLIDITEKKRALENLRESEDLFKMIIKYAPYLISLTDMNNKLVVVNDAFCETTNLDESFVLGKTVQEIGFEMLLEPVPLAQTNFTNEDIDNVIISFNSKLDGYKDFLYSRRKIQWKNHPMFLNVTIDVTEKNKIEKELKKYKEQLEILVSERTDELHSTIEELNATNAELYNQREELQSILETLYDTQNQLIQSEKMASLGVLSAGIAHEINNPLNYIAGGISAIDTYLTEYAPNILEEMQPMIDAINTGVKRASEIIISLSHYSRHDELPHSDCNIHAIIDNCLVMVNNKLKNKVLIKKQYSEKTPIIFGNESKLHQVFLNILVNAEQAIQDNGVITIETIISGTNICITIHDTGCGIKVEIIDKIFDPFFTTKPPGKGTGLGLSITYNIIVEHQGTIEFQSDEGKGTTAIIKLPLKIQEE